jgi:hypothetical protein
MSILGICGGGLDLVAVRLAGWAWLIRLSIVTWHLVSMQLINRHATITVALVVLTLAVVSVAAAR